VWNLKPFDYAKERLFQMGQRASTLNTSYCMMWVVAKCYKYDVLPQDLFILKVKVRAVGVGAPKQ
jgi:hypothetical protein